MLGQAAAAQTIQLKSWDTSVTLDADSSSWEISLEYADTVLKDDIWVLGRIDTFEAFVDGAPADCELKRDIGSAIFCNIPGKQYKYVFTTDALATNLRNYLNFRYNFAATRITDRFTVTVKIPLGAALVEAERLTGTGLRPFEPGFGQQGTDGRRILVRWDLITPKLGETIPVGLVYEQLTPFSSEQLPVIAGIIAFVVAGIAFYLLKSRAGAAAAAPTWKLNKDERSLLNFIATHGKIEQAELVKELKLNKVKVSRMVSRLEDLGFVKATKIGRKHILSTTQRAVEADWLVHLNELKENVAKPWLAGLDEWHGEGDAPPLRLGLSTKIRKPLFDDMKNHFPSLMLAWSRLWRDYTKYMRAWGRARQALQATAEKQGEIISTSKAGELLKKAGEGLDTEGIVLSKHTVRGGRKLAATERKLKSRIAEFREMLEKYRHYTKLPGSCEYIE
jgi:uncharacterized membrane protein